MGDIRPGRGRQVSMESGLEDRNNYGHAGAAARSLPCLNGVRPRRPEQLGDRRSERLPRRPVSMESGLEDRNN